MYLSSWGSSGLVNTVVGVVFEWHDEFGPAGKVSADLHLNELSEPSDVLNFLLLQLEIGEEASDVETTFKSFTVTATGFLQHNIVDG